MKQVMYNRIIPTKYPCILKKIMFHNQDLNHSWRQSGISRIRTGQCLVQNSTFPSSLAEDTVIFILSLSIMAFMSVAP